MSEPMQGRKTVWCGFAGDGKAVYADVDGQCPRCSKYGHLGTKFPVFELADNRSDEQLATRTMVIGESVQALEGYAARLGVQIPAILANRIEHFLGVAFDQGCSTGWGEAAD